MAEASDKEKRHEDDKEKRRKQLKKDERSYQRHLKRVKPNHFRGMSGLIFRHYESSCGKICITVPFYVSHVGIALYQPCRNITNDRK